VIEYLIYGFGALALIGAVVFSAKMWGKSGQAAKQLKEAQKDARKANEIRAKVDKLDDAAVAKRLRRWTR